MRSNINKIVKPRRLEKTQDSTGREPSRPLLRWAGSKRQIVPKLKKLIPKDYKRYVEPFAGSAALFFSLAPKKAILSDTNDELINFYRAFQQRPEAVVTEARALSRSKKNYLQIRKAVPSHRHTFKRAVRFFYLNRLCFNGVYRVNRDGQFNVPKGKKPTPFPSLKSLPHLAKNLSRAELKCSDFQSVVNRCGKGDFIYADPPYYSARHRGEYGIQAFGLEDLSRLAAALRAARSRGAQIALSYANSKQLELLFPGWRIRRVSVIRNVAADAKLRGRGSEALVTSFDIR